MSAQTARIVCRPWCQDGDGNPGEHPDDQWCASEWDSTVQSLAPMWEDSEGQWHPSVVQTRAEAGPHHPVQVALYRQAGDVALSLTPAEARSLARSLMESADLADGADQ